jgi:chalcone isomerase-like protein
MPRIEYHNSLYVDVKPGDRYSLTYVPGQGTKLRLNGVERGTIEGADFAAAIFSIWLGAKPMDNKFKRSLLGMR